MTSSAVSRSYWPAKGLAALLDFAASAHGRAIALLVLVSLLSFLPGFFQIPPVDRDESYFAQATKQMIETGDYVNIRYQDDVRYRKPVGIYWLQAAAVNTARALGLRNALTTIWLYRLPSLLGAVGAVLATYWCALAFVGRRGAVIAALMMAGAIALGVEARLAKTDAVLLFTTVLAMGVLARAYLGPHASSEPGAAGAATHSWSTPALFWTALAAGILVKGPLILMFVALAAATVSIIDRSARWLAALRPLPGLVWMLLLVLPWFIAIYLRAGDAFLVDSVGHDMLAKIGGGQETHGAPPGVYFLLFFVTFFPGSALALIATPAIWSARRQATTRFLLAWLVPSWIVFELVPTKLPHYVLPLYPAIAILIAASMQAGTLSKRPLLARAALWWAIAPLVFSGVAIAASFIMGGHLALAAWPFFAAAILCGVYAWRSYGADGAELAFLRGLAAAILLAIGICGIVLPSLDAAFPGVALARLLHGVACDHPVAASAGYEEPSVVFLAGTETHLTDGAGAADFLRADHPHQARCRIAFVEAREEAAFAKRAGAIGLHYGAAGQLHGLNISNGHWIDVTAFQSAGGR
jgi:4-amino-4-deoxy-L-arabinose transferase-like glycosyltransferase